MANAVDRGPKKKPQVNLTNKIGVKSTALDVMLPVKLQIALGHMQAGRLSLAESVYEQILLTNGKQADALHMLGLVLAKQGKYSEALGLIKQALDVRPNEVGFLLNLGNVQLDAGNCDSALESYEKALDLRRNMPEIHNARGNALRALSRQIEAGQSYSKAIKLFPNYAEAHNNMGNIFRDQGNFKEALASYNSAIRISPQYADAYCNMGNVLKDMSRLEEALLYYQRAIQINPGSPKIFENMGNACWVKGDIKLAKISFERSLALQESARVRIKHATMLPAIMGTTKELTETRVGFEQAIEKLIEDRLTLQDPLVEDCLPNFHLAFHGHNDKRVQQRVAHFYEQACPSLLYESPHCQDAKKINQPTQIGFISKYIHNHSVSKSFEKIISQLAIAGDFEVTVISCQSEDYDFNIKARSSGTKSCVNIPSNLSKARQVISALQLDILVYLDIGMDPLTYFLAFSRLAKIQCVLGGHPVTTGITNMDYFLSSELMETAEADSHYSEKLVRLPFGSFYFERPLLPAQFKTRAELNFPTTGSIYLCPMTLQKIHPDFDGAINGILQTDKEGFVVFFEDRRDRYWHIDLQKRFNLTIHVELRDRVIFLPWIMDYQDFLSANAAANVVLDPFHFGIGTTSIATYSVGTPVVTKPSNFMRGRVGYALCKMMDLMECVAVDNEDYVREAVKIATDSKYRESIKQKILRNNNILFENEKGITDVADFFKKIPIGA
jgi:predicted O-linked N-acetylglucosamine transferase (SPINDLY family)